MVTRPTPTKRRSTAKRPVRSKAVAASMTAAPLPMTDMTMRLDAAGRSLTVARHAAGKFMLSSMRELTTAAAEVREPMHALLRTMRVTGRHIARHARAAWAEALPAAMPNRPVRRARASALRS